MTKRYLAPLACGCVLLHAGHAAAAAPVAKAGYYAGLHYILSASVSGAGQCLDAQGTYYTNEGYYPGPSKPGDMTWRFINVQGLLGEYVSNFPTTPPAGVTHSSGTYTNTFLPGGSPVSATYDQTTTVLDTHSSIITITLVYPTTAGGTCTTTEQDNYVATDK